MTVSPEQHVVVIGAGVAGLAAAGRLRQAGARVTLIEAGPAIGGRARTLRPAVLGGAVFDAGAQWLHGAEHNPLLPVVQAAGEAVGPDRFAGAVLRDGRGGAVESAAFDAASGRWSAAVRARVAHGDLSLAAAGEAAAADPLMATVEAWESQIISAADADAFGAADWAANALEGSNFVPPDGLGAMLARVLGPAAGPVRLGVAARAITATAAGVRVETTDGAVEADRAIVTVSTGVLRAEAIRFHPALPDATRQAIAGLPMGLATKVALPARGAGRLGMAAGSDLMRVLARRGEPLWATLCWPGGRGYCTGFIGGGFAWSLAARPAEAVALLRAEIAALLGAEAAGALGEAGEVSDWGRNPRFLGAYSYAVPGAAGARAALGAPVWDGRLIFAGEATAAGLAGTVGGAWRSGVEAADASGGQGALPPGPPPRASPWNP